MSEFYAIIQKSTGSMLPNGRVGGIDGPTHQEPSSTRPPRLFSSTVYANRALVAYLKGKWIQGPNGPRPKNGTVRNPEEFEIVKVNLLVYPAAGGGE